jgi:hypothetical protein
MQGLFCQKKGHFRQMIACRHKEKQIAYKDFASAYGKKRRSLLILAYAYRKKCMVYRNIRNAHDHCPWDDHQSGSFVGRARVLEGFFGVVGGMMGYFKDRKPLFAC